MAHQGVNSAFELLEVAGAFGFESGEVFDEGEGELEVELELLVGGVGRGDGGVGDVDEAQHVGEGSAEADLDPELLQYFEEHGVFVDGVRPDVFDLFHADHSLSVESHTQFDGFSEDLDVLVVQEQQLETAAFGEHLSPSFASDAPVFLFSHGQLAVVFETIDASEFAFEFIASYEDEGYFDFGGLEPFDGFGSFVVLGVDVFDVEEQKLYFSVDFVVFHIFGR